MGVRVQILTGEKDLVAKDSTAFRIRPRVAKKSREFVNVHNQPVCEEQRKRARRLAHRTRFGHAIHVVISLASFWISSAQADVS
jgi:hypothetical protein